MHNLIEILLNELTEEFKYEPEFRFERDREIIYCSYQKTKYCGIFISKDRTLIYIYNMYYVHKYLLDDPKCFNNLFEEIRKQTKNDNIYQFLDWDNLFRDNLFETKAN